MPFFTLSCGVPWKQTNDCVYIVLGGRWSQGIWVRNNIEWTRGKGKPKIKDASINWPSLCIPTAHSEGPFEKPHELCFRTVWQVMKEKLLSPINQNTPYFRAAQISTLRRFLQASHGTTAQKLWADSDVLSHSFYGSEVQEKLSWVALAQDLLWG